VASSVPTAIDLTGLTQLRANAAREDPAALAEAAVQFEALFIGMMLKTARDASLGEGLFDGQETRQYLELMDSQVALELARKGGFGFGRMIVEQLVKGEGAPGSAATAPQAFDLRDVLRGPIGVTDSVRAPSGGVPAALAPRDPAQEFPRGLPPSLRGLGSPGAAASPAEASTGKTALTGSAEDFVTRFLGEATTAAKALGVEPRLLLAQAALETGWGGESPLHPDGRPANNLFGIKAGSSWRGSRVAQWTIEHGEGGATRRREEFRAYPHTADSFADYVSLISSSPRYAAALEKAHDAEAYARAIGAAGYATDPDYAEKWLSIYHGDRLGGALRELKTGDLEPTQ
jgi:peptidoglycan hydrolase FlgJ